MNLVINLKFSLIYGVVSAQRTQYNKIIQLEIILIYYYDFFLERIELFKAKSTLCVFWLIEFMIFLKVRIIFVDSIKHSHLFKQQSL